MKISKTFAEACLKFKSSPAIIKCPVELTGKKFSSSFNKP